MHRIDSPSATPDHMFTEGSPTGGVPATTVTDDWLNDVQENIMAVIEAGGVTPVKGRASDLLAAIRGLGLSAFGPALRARMTLTAPSASANWSADQITVASSLGGSSYGLSAFSASINLATVGLGGMNAGQAPVNGWVAIYAIYNPTTGVSGLLAMDSTSMVAPEIFSGSGIPAGFTASALVAVWRTNASRQLIIGGLRGRSVSFPFTVAVSVGGTVSAFTAISLVNYVPPNAIACGGFMTTVGISTTNAQTSVASDASGSGLAQTAGNSTTGGVQNISAAPFNGMKILTQQTLYWQTKASSGDYNGGAVYISSYDF